MAKRGWMDGMSVMIFLGGEGRGTRVLDDEPIYMYVYIYIYICT